MRLQTAVLLVSCLTCSVFSQTYTIKTAVGGGLPVNLSGTAATLGSVKGVAIDSSGNVLITDAAYSSILRLDVKTGTLTLVAGNGTVGFSGDGGPATSAQLNFSGVPNVAVDPAGNIYIVDTNNNRVRKVSNGVITTFAGNGMRGSSGDGGPATSAQLNQPNGIAVDAVGNLYIGDFLTIRKVSNGMITTVVGNVTGATGGDGGPATSAQIGNNHQLALDTAGNLYIADTNFSRVRKVSNGVITTVAGNGTAGSGGDGGPATSAQLGSPYGIALDAAGNLYIADLLYSRIRKVTNGVISTVAGNGTQGFSGDNGAATGAQIVWPIGVAVDPSANLYIADSLNFRIRKVSNGVITTVAGGGLASIGDGGTATNAQLNVSYGGSPGIAIDRGGNLYISDVNSHRVRKVSNGIVTTVAGNGTLGFSGDNGPATSAQLYRPSGVALDASGNLYIADSFNGRVRKVTNGVISTVAGNGNTTFSGDNGPATSASLWDPLGVALDAAGNLYIADTSNYRIRKVSNGVITTVAGNGTFGFSGDNGPATAASLAAPVAIVVDSVGNLYTSVFAGGRIRKVSNGIITTVAGDGTVGFSGDGGPATSAQIDYSDGISTDTAGNIYFTELTNNRLRKVSGGVITTIAGGGMVFGDNGIATNAQLSYPSGVTVDSSGNVYFVDSGNNRVRVLTPSVLSNMAILTNSLLPDGAIGVAYSQGLTATGGLTPYKGWSVSPGSQLPSGLSVTQGVLSGTGLLSGIPTSAGSFSFTLQVTDANNVVASKQFNLAISSPISLSTTGILNAASYVGGSIAPGEIVTIFGSFKGPASVVTLQLDSRG